MFIDLHCDALHRLERTHSTLRSSGGSVDIKALLRGDALCQCFAAFVDISKTDTPYEQGKKLAAIFESELEKNKAHLVKAVCAADITAARKSGKIAAMLTVEEGEVCGGSPERLAEFYNMGARMMTLTWNYKNRFAYPNAYGSPSTAAVNLAGGLTAKGFELVEEMDRLGMIVDLSHLSDKGFYDVLSHSKRPPVASHSNARAVASHPRNLTDDMIRRLSLSGGVMGLNFYHAFLSDNSGGLSRISDMIAHLKHIKRVGGIEVMALGSDFDGISGRLEIKNSGEIPLLVDAMRFDGFSSSEIDAVMWKNAMRVFETL